MAMSASFFNMMFSPTLHSRGWGVEEEGGMARSRGTGLTRKGSHREGTGKAWPLLFSASSHPIGFLLEQG